MADYNYRHYDMSTVTAGVDLITAGKTDGTTDKSINRLIYNLYHERERRSAGSVTLPNFVSGNSPIKVSTFTDMNWAINRLQTVSGLPDIQANNPIRAIHYNAYVTVLDAMWRTCICNCNYCTCNCNYCTCNCNYCTCDCNYNCTCQCDYSSVNTPTCIDNTGAGYGCSAHTYNCSTNVSRTYNLITTCKAQSIGSSTGTSKDIGYGTVSFTYCSTQVGTLTGSRRAVSPAGRQCIANVVGSHTTDDSNAGR